MGAGSAKIRSYDTDRFTPQIYYADFSAMFESKEIDDYAMDNDEDAAIVRGVALALTTYKNADDWAAAVADKVYKEKLIEFEAESKKFWLSMLVAGMKDFSWLSTRQCTWTTKKVFIHDVCKLAGVEDAKFVLSPIEPVKVKAISCLRLDITPNDKKDFVGFFSPISLCGYDEEKGVLLIDCFQFVFYTTGMVFYKVSLKREVDALLDLIKLRAVDTLYIQLY